MNLVNMLYFPNTSQFSHRQSFYREWIRKSFPADREGLAVLNPILPCEWWRNGHRHHHREESGPFWWIIDHAWGSRTWTCIAIDLTQVSILPPLSQNYRLHDHYYPQWSSCSLSSSSSSGSTCSRSRSFSPSPSSRSPSSRSFSPVEKDNWSKKPPSSSLPVHM